MTNRDGSDITMSNIKTKIKESLGLPQSLSPETMFPSPKFEALTKIMSGLLRRSQTHPESQKTAFRKTATPESGYSQPGVPASTYSQPVAPVSGYSQPAIPPSGYSQMDTVNQQLQQVATVSLQCLNNLLQYLHISQSMITFSFPLVFRFYCNMLLQ